MLPKCRDIPGEEGDTAASRAAESHCCFQHFLGCYTAFHYLICCLQQMPGEEQVIASIQAKSKAPQQTAAVLGRFGLKSAWSSSCQVATCCRLGSSFAFAVSPWPSCSQWGPVPGGVNARRHPAVGRQLGCGQAFL